MRPLFATTVMPGSILPSRVSTTFTLVKTSVCADASGFDCAQMYGFRQRKVSKNARIPQPLKQAEKTVGEAYDRAAAQSTNFSCPFSPEGCMNGTFVQCGQRRHGHTQIRAHDHP